MSSVSDDEALARALQQQFQRDYEAATAPASRRPPATAPSERMTVPPASVESDEELARRLEQEMRDEAIARRLSADGSGTSNSRRRGTYSAGAPVTDSVIMPASATTSPPRRSRRTSERTSSRSRPSSRNQSRPSSTRHSSSQRRESTSRSRSSSRHDVSRSTDVNPNTSRRPRSSHSTPRSNNSSRPSSSHNSPRSNNRGRSVNPTPSPPQLSSIDDQGFPMVIATPVEQAPFEQYPDEPDDIEIARKLEQEERDAALAEQLARADQEVASRRATASAIRDHNNHERQNNAHQVRPCTCRRVMVTVLPATILLVAIIAVALVLTGGDVSSIPNIFDGSDPFEGGGTTPQDANRWDIGRSSGLRLEVINALQEPWFPSFNVAMQEWEGGTPDALTLSVSSEPYDYDCRQVQGKMKVCNGNYGDTRWKGINQVLLNNGWIVSSVAKLNDFYLGDSDGGQRQYTMCHEIGHGFGLPHTDEDFFNKDLGNCMDYTDNPEANKSPDESNYNFLFDMYGPAQGRRLTESNVFLDTLPADLESRYEAAVRQLELNLDDGAWTLVENNPYGEVRSFDLQDGYTLKVEMLLAHEED